MVKNRTSPKKPLIAAFTVACLSMLFAVGYRGKFKPSEASLGLNESIRLFVFVLAGGFIVFYLLRLLGVQMGPMEQGKGSGLKS